MDDLRILYEKLGFTDIITYIQSGNVVFNFEKKKSRKEIALQIEKIINKNYGFNVPVIIRTAKEIHNVIISNPFLENYKVDFERLYLTFLAEIPSPEKIEKLKDFSFTPDKFKIIKNNVFIYCSASTVLQN